MVMDLGFKSDPNLHRAHRGPFRVRIEARQTVGAAARLRENLESGSRADKIERTKEDKYVCDRHRERRWAKQQHRKAAVCIQSAQHRTACGSEESDPPFPFPPRGKPGRGKVPPTPRHVPRQPTTLARPMLRLPPQEGLSPPLRHPPTSLSRCLQTRAIAPGKKNKDGRHVGLDFYDLLIEVTFTTFS
jgi:hypothetical protein